MPVPRALAILTLATASIALASCSYSATNLAAKQSAREPCLRVDEISSWSLVNDDTRVIVKATARRHFQIDLMGTCRQFDQTRALGFETTDGSGAARLICPSQAAQLTVIMPSSNSVLRCPVTAIRRMEPDEIAALPRRDRP